MAESMNALRDRARAAIPGGVTSAVRASDAPLIIARAEGAYLWDVTGQRYLDHHCAFGPIVLGHRHPDVDAAVKDTIDTLDLTGVGVSEIEIQLAEKIRQHVPCAEKVQLACTGSDVTYHAIRLARAVTGKMKIVKFQGAYHGWYDYVCMNTISTRENLGRYDVYSAGVLPAAYEHTLVLPFNDLEAVKGLLEGQGGEIAAILVEPIVHNSGCIMPQPGFLEGLRTLTQQHNVLLIFDEVITGIRHALGGYQQICGVTPDLTTLGKALGNGYPISALCGQAEYMDRCSTGGGDVFYAGTYNGNPSPVRAAIATIEIMERTDVHAQLFHLGDLLRNELNAMVRQLGVPAHCAGFGSLYALYFLEPPVDRFDDLLRNDTALDAGVRQRLQEKHVIVHPAPLARGHCCAAHTEDDIAVTVQAYREAIQETLSSRES